MIGRVINDASNRITQHYGNNGHTGVDLGWRSDEIQNRVFAHSAGTVVAAVDGYDTMVGSSGMLSYGNYIDIDHGNGYKTRYAHLRKNTVSVSVGQHVDANTQIAVIGESGNVSGRHLHFEVFQNGNRINPEPYLNQEFSGSSGGNLTYQSHDSAYGWNPNVIIGSGEYAGNFGCHMDAIYLDQYRLRVHDMVKGYWLPWVQNRNDYAGNLGNAIDGIQIEGVAYRAHITNGGWLPWVYKADDTADGYAGIYGQPIDALEIKYL